MKHTPEQWVEFWLMNFTRDTFTRNVRTPRKDILAAFAEAVRAEAMVDAALACEPTCGGYVDDKENT